ncbi:uncharacterized protein LOC114530780 [Dendronephthya gigantea]|uniref:uncharacterized protein LOC114530780 n=1 Tax=Dendronephthya gigantea TaxID=151771 RepID=UPI0010696D96|nr:uncharacterized protein LOC114530780 [Dendronephthya gigantea]
MSWVAQDLNQEWRRFYRQAMCIFEGPLHDKEDSVKVSYVKLWVGDKGLDVFEGFTFAEPADAKKLDIVLKKFEDYCTPRKNYIMAALKFNERRQGENESFESFVTDLRILVKDCGYRDEERMVRDAIWFSCKHIKVREKCIDLADTLTLEKAIEIGRSHETNLASLKKLTKEEDPSINAIKQEQYRQRDPRNRRYSNKRQTERENPNAEGDSMLKDRCGRWFSIKVTRNAQQWVNNHKLKPFGEVVLKVKYKDHIEDVKFFVVEAEVESVLSGNTCVKLGLLKRVYQVVSQKAAPEKVELDDYPELFKGLGCLPGYHIELNEGATPVVHAPRKVPIPQREKVIEELKRMERLGVIVRQEEATDWVNSMVVVQKPNGAVRLCIDPRDLNAAMKRSHHPKTVDEVASRLEGANIFSILDAKNGFWQLKLDEESSLLCTFNTPIGRYRFTRLPFGVKCAPEIFQRTMDRMVEDLDGVEVIMDDVIVAGDENA